MVASYHLVEYIEFVNSYHIKDWLLLVHLHLLQEHYNKYQNVAMTD